MLALWHPPRLIGFRLLATLVNQMVGLTVFWPKARNPLPKHAQECQYGHPTTASVAGNDSSFLRSPLFLLIPSSAKESFSRHRTTCLSRAFRVTLLLSELQVVCALHH